MKQILSRTAQSILELNIAPCCSAPNQQVFLEKYDDDGKEAKWKKSVKWKKADNALARFKDATGFKDASFVCNTSPCTNMKDLIEKTPHPRHLQI